MSATGAAHAQTRSTDEPGVWLRSLGAMSLALAVSLVATACSSAPESPTRSVSKNTSSPVSESAPATMPLVAGRSVQEVGERLAAFGFDVRVQLPARHFTADEQGRRDRGRKGATRDLSWPTKTVPFGSMAGWAQVLAGSQPRSGGVLEPGQRIVLIAGRHRGGDRSMPYVWEHVADIQANGGSSCIKLCHKDSAFCSDCHREMLPPNP